jgi:hypothetical protein
MNSYREIGISRLFENTNWNYAIARTSEKAPKLVSRAAIGALPSRPEVSSMGHHAPPWGRCRRGVSTATPAGNVCENNGGGFF